MKISNMLATAGEWLRGEGPHHQIVISSRVRLARNLRNRPFPGWAKKAERSSILELIRSPVSALPEMQEAFAESLQDLSALDRQVLVERHLISREHAAKGAGSARSRPHERMLSTASRLHRPSDKARRQASSTASRPSASRRERPRRSDW